MRTADRVSVLRVLALYLGLPALLFGLLSNVLFDSRPVIALLAAYRPTTGQSTLEVNVARQVLFMDATLRNSGDGQRIAVIGSSSVVNGVDAGIVQDSLRAQGYRQDFVNLGQTGFVAYELALLRRFTLDPSIGTMVFLYNSFSFADRLLGTVVGVRWDTREMWGLQPPDWRVAEDWKRYVTGYVNEHLALVRYAPVLRNTAMRALRGQLAPTPYFPDFPPEPGLDQRRPRDPETAAADKDWLRKAYVDSASANDTVGYRGFERYLQLAREQGIRVIVAPVPEPEFSRINRWRVGTDPDSVDRRVAEIVRRNGAILWTRDRMRPFEADDTLFRDPTHFNRFGRAQFSKELADWIVWDLKGQ